MSVGSTAVKGTAWNLAESLGSQLATFALFMVLARLLSVDEVGTVAAANALLAFLILFVEQGYATAIMRAEKLSDGLLNTSFWLSILGALVVAFTLSVASNAVGRAYDNAALGPVLIALSLSMIVEVAATIHRAILIRELRFKDQAKSRLLGVVIGFCVGLGLAIAGAGVWSVVAKQASEVFVYTVAVWRQTAWRPKLQIDRAQTRELFSFGSRLTVARVCAFAIRRADEFIVGLSQGSIAMGTYSVAMRAVVLIVALLESLDRTALPLLARLSHSGSDSRDSCAKSVELYTAVIVPSYVGIALVAPELISLLFGAKWLPAVLPMRILALGSISAGIYQVVPVLLLAKGEAAVHLRLSLFEAIVAAVVAAVAAPFGLVAIATATAARGLLFMPVRFLLLKRLAPGSEIDSLKAIVRTTASACVMSLCVYGLRQVVDPIGLPQALSLALYVVLAAVVYIASMLALGNRLLLQLIRSRLASAKT